MAVLTEQDIDLGVLRSKRIGVIGYGAQGHAHALNLADGGYHVTVGLRASSAHRTVAEEAGLDVAPIEDVALHSDVVMMLVPDEVQPAVYAEHVAPRLKPGAYVGFAHGFAVHYGQIRPADDVNVFLVAPNGVGTMVRREFEQGHGVPAAVAVGHDASGDTRAVALAYACAIGCGRAAIVETTFREETESDLFAEQAVLCGGMNALVVAAFDTLVEAGYSEEMAYFCCLHEVKLLADLVHERGIAGTRAAISNTAAYGDLTRGPRVIGPASRRALREMLDEIRGGVFAREWQGEHDAGLARLAELQRVAARHRIEAVGARLRARMPWLQE